MQSCTSSQLLDHLCGTVAKGVCRIYALTEKFSIPKIVKKAFGIIYGLKVIRIHF